MLARQQNQRNDPSLSQEVNQARATLRRKGWTYRSGAKALNRDWTHLAKVLTGKRTSKKLLVDIDQLPCAPATKMRAANQAKRA